MVLKLKDKEIWKKLLLKINSKNRDIYYTPEYYSLYQDLGDGTALCFVYESNAEIAIYPFLINSVNSLGFDLDKEYFDIQGAYGYNGILSNTNDPDFIKRFYISFSNYCNENNIVAEFTRFNPNLNNHIFSQGWMDVFFDRKTISLDLTLSKEEIWTNSYSSKNRNMIRKALKNEVEIFISNKEDDYAIFYSIYKQTMINVNAKSYLYFNEEYFNNFLNFLPENHELVLAKYNNQIVGGMILLFHENFAHYHLSARLSEYGSLALNNLFLNYSINLAREKKCKIFHFGGGTTSNIKDSLLKFKMNFSNETKDFYFGKKIHNKKIYNEIINQWKCSNYMSYKINKNLILGYREN